VSIALSLNLPTIPVWGVVAVGEVKGRKWVRKRRRTVTKDFLLCFGDIT